MNIAARSYFHVLTIINLRGVPLELREYSRDRRTYGGSFSKGQDLKEGSSGKVTNFKNGTPLVKHPLLWEGLVIVFLLFLHPWGTKGLLPSRE